MTVSIKQAQLELTELIVRSSRGEEIAIANDGGKVVARIVAASPASEQRISVLDRISSLPEHTRTPAQWEQIERDFQQERNSWDR